MEGSNTCSTTIIIIYIAKCNYSQINEGVAMYTHTQHVHVHVHKHVVTCVLHVHVHVFHIAAGRAGCQARARVRG